MNSDLKSRLVAIEGGAEAVREMDARDAEIERLRAQLEWYGDKALLCRDDWQLDGSGVRALREDAGERAREALKGGDDE